MEVLSLFLSFSLQDPDLGGKLNADPNLQPWKKVKFNFINKKDSSKQESPVWSFLSTEVVLPRLVSLCRLAAQPAGSPATRSSAMLLLLFSLCIGKVITSSNAAN